MTGAVRRTAEVVVVGGGCMGVSAAYHLTRRGVTEVVLLEREARLGAGSTGRNAGGVRHQFSHPANIALSLESIAALKSFEAEVGVAVDFHQDGYLFLLTSELSERDFRGHVELQRRLGVPVDWLTPDEAARRAPGLAVDDVRAATFCGWDGIADPHGVTQGYAAAARRAGVEIALETELTGVRTAGGRIAGVDTSAGPIDAPVVVNAAGPWAGRVGRLAGLAVPVEPLRRHIFVARPAGEASWDTPPHRGRVPGSRVLVIDFETSFYFHRDGAPLLFGMGDPDERPGFDVDVRWDFLPQVIEVATRRLPALADAEVVNAWAGLYEMTPDAMPILGPVEALPGYHLIAGFSGHGFQHCPAAGRIVADRICGRDPGIDLAPFAFERFAEGTQPGRSGERNVV